MVARRLSLWALVLLIGGVGLLGCEPYMSMTDQVTVQTRQASALLPENPKFVGMMNVQSVMEQVERLRRATHPDSLRATGDDTFRALLDATGVDPRSDLEAVYAATEGDAFTAVLFASITPDQLDRFQDVAPSGAIRTSTYRDVPVYRLQFGEGGRDANALSVAFVDDGTIVAASNDDRMEAAVDRHRDTQGRLQDNEEYMTLVERVGRGSTAWLVGSNVLKSALGDPSASTASTAGAESNGDTAGVAQAGLQSALVEWSNRVLGLSEMSSGVPALSGDALEGEAMGRVRDLREKVRRQALSITLTETTVEGNAYLSMTDDAEAGSVVEMARGGLALLRFSRSELSGQKQALADDFLEEASVEQDDALVHVRFSVRREFLKEMETAARAPAPDTVHRAVAGTRPEDATFRRFAGIKWGGSLL